MSFQVGDVVIFRRPHSWEGRVMMRVRAVSTCSSTCYEKKFCSHCDHQLYTGSAITYPSARIVQRYKRLAGFFVRKAIPAEEARYYLYTRLKKGDLVEFKSHTGALQIGWVYGRRGQNVYIRSAKPGGFVERVSLPSLTRRFLRGDKKTRLLIEQL